MTSPDARGHVNVHVNAGPNPRPRSSPKVTLAPSSSRVDSILHGARERAIGHESSSSPSACADANAVSTDPLTAMPGATRTPGKGTVGVVEGESSADESTSIVRKGSRPNVDYQATSQRAVGSSAAAASTKGAARALRSRPSTASIRRSGRVYEGPLGEEGDEEEEGGVNEGWWARMLSEYGSIELENKGSVARDHLALERTFLAWLRTSLAFASIGIAITQLFRLNTTSSASSSGVDGYKHLRQMGKPLGATFLGISIMMLGVGFHRYFESQHWIIRGKFPASRGSVVLVALVTFCLMITSLVVVVAVEPGSFEKR